MWKRCHQRMNIERIENQVIIQALNALREEAIRYINKGKTLEEFRKERIIPALETELDIGANWMSTRWFVKKQIVKATS